MSLIKVNLPVGVIPTVGLQTSFIAPCDCTTVTGLSIDSTEYSIVDAMGHDISGKRDMWCSGAVVSVLLDPTNKRAFLLNAASLCSAVPIAKGGTGATDSETARKNLGAAASDHNHSASDINDGILSSARLPVVPVTKGGTGANTAADARSSLGITPDNIGALPKSGGTMTGNLNMNGGTFILKEVINYGTTLPAAGIKGRLFFKVVK